MKLLKAEITGFGKWQQQEIVFYEGNQLFFGLNEEGKSTIYHFISAMLFGFPVKGKKKADYTPRNGAAYGGKLWIEHPVYGELQIERYKNKNRGKASISYQDETADEDFLREILDPLTETTFRNVFTLNQEQLTNLYQLEEDQLHEALVSLGASGSSDLYQLRQQYLVESQRIFKRRGVKQPLNQKLKEWQELETKIQEKLQQEQQVGSLLNQQAHLRDEIAKIKQKMSVVDLKLAKAQQQQQYWPRYEEWQALADQGESKFSAEDLQILSKLAQEYQRTTERIEELNRMREHEKRANSGTPAFFFFLENEALVKELAAMESVVIRSHERLNYHQSQFGEQKRLDDLEFKWGWSQEQMPKRIPEEQQQKLAERYQKLSKEKGQLEMKLDLAQEQLKEAESKMTEAQADSDEKPKPQRTAIIPYFFFAEGIFCIVLGFFVKNWIQIGAFLLGAIGIVMGIYSYSRSKNTENPEEQEWHDKLVFLGELQASTTKTRAALDSVKEKLDSFEEEFHKMVLEYNLGRRISLENLNNAMIDLDQYLFYYNQTAGVSDVQKESQEELQKFQKQSQILLPWLPLQNATIEQQFQLIRAFVNEMEKERYQNPEQQILLIQNELQQQQQKEQSILANLRPLMEKYQITYPSELFFVLEDEIIKQKMTVRKQDLAELIRDIYPEDAIVSKAEVEENLQTEDVKKRQIQALFEEKLAAQKEIQVKLDTMQQDGTLDELYHERAQKKAEIEELAVSWANYRLTDNILKDLSTELSQQQLPQLLAKAGKYLAILTNKRYQRMSLVENTLVISRGTEHFSIYELSTGTKDQVIMALRFAFLALESNRELAPIMVDDGWLHYDYQRKHQLANLLIEFGKEHQTICFSSDREMLLYYQEAKQPVCLLGGIDNEKN